MKRDNQNTKASQSYHRALTIAGSDSGGGAGIQADLKTFASLGCFGMSVITALTAQNTKGVAAISPVPVDFVREQLQAVLSDIGSDAVKIGMLFSPELIATVADELSNRNVSNIVLDPVMVAQSGDRLLQDEAIEALIHHLLPLADIVTPNIPEAEVLTGLAIRSDANRREAALKLSQAGCKAVLIKGGHLEGQQSDDLLYLSQTDAFIKFAGQRVTTTNNHGTGCTLSSAIASMIAKGETIEGAVGKAKQYIQGAIEAGAQYQIGNGHGPVHHFYQHWS